MNNEVYLSSYGEDILDMLSKHQPDPVLLIGDTGWGKTTLLKHYANQNGREFTGINFFPKQNVDQLVGMWRPIPTETGITVDWQDGLLTDAIRNGKIFLGEELTRAPRDLAGRLLGILDSADRYWSLPEAGVPSVPVSDDFWFLASANPVSGDYATVTLDPALVRRFSLIVTIEQPVADEVKLLNHIAAKSIHDPAGFAERLVAWAGDLRNDKSTRINTGDLVRVARAVTEKRIEPVAALDQTLTYKYKNVGVMRTSFTGHFETFDLKYLTKAQRKATVKPVAKVEEPKVIKPEDLRQLAEEPVLTQEPVVVDITEAVVPVSIEELDRKAEESIVKEPVVEEPVVEEVETEESVPTLEEVLAQLRQAVRS